LRQFGELHKITGILLNLPVQLFQILLQLLHLLIDGFIVALFLIAHAQFALPHALRRGLHGLLLRLFLGFLCDARIEIVAERADILRQPAARLKGKQPPGHAVEEVAVMRNDYHRALERGQVIFQNFQRRDIQIVGRFIQQQHVWRSHQQTGQIEPPLFAAREPLHRSILHIRRKKKLLKHLRRGEPPVRRFHIFGNVAHEINQPHIRLHLRKFLCEKSDFHGFADGNRAGVRRKLTGKHAQQRRFTAAVRPDDSHALIPQNGIGEIRNELPPAERLADRFAFDNAPSETRAG